MQQDDMEDELVKSLKILLERQELGSHQKIISRISSEQNISILDCAAALSLLNQENNKLLKKPSPEKKPDGNRKKISPQDLPKQKTVRYRLDIGKKHQVSVDEIKNVLIEVSGVDNTSIGRLDIRNFYTMVDLPDGMPADIFQLLAETKIKKQLLNIKRIKYQRRYHRRNHK